MHFKVLAQGVEHYKETEKGRETMCDAVREYAKEYAKEYARENVMIAKTDIARNLMKNSGFTLDQALNVLDLNSEDRSLLTEELKNC